MNNLVVEELPLLGAPVDVFETLRTRPGAFLLESVMQHPELAGHSFIGFDPFLTLQVAGGVTCVREGGKTSTRSGDGRAVLRELLSRFKSAPQRMFPFAGGAVGYFGYEWGADAEGVRPRPTSEAPQVELGFYDGILAYEHASGRWSAVANPVHERTAAQILRALRDAADQTISWEPVGSAEQVGSDDLSPVAVEPRERYLAAVHRAREYISAGDIYQVNLAHRFEAPLRGGPFELYRRLRAQSPAPFACYLTTSFGHVVSCSPELFLRVRDGLVVTRPIKGTRPRGRDDQEDQRLADELLASAKERAELLMIVDLERNDLGRVCVPGSIRVTDLYRLEKHPTVFHLVATVEGRLREGCDAVEMLRAAFPGGSITGAPKIRAMQIIRELESSPRDVYTGSIGYLGFDGNCDLNIAIRTIVCRGGVASYHVGAGIVWDSVAEAEYEETLAKGRALAAALTHLSNPGIGQTST